MIIAVLNTSGGALSRGAVVKQTGTSRLNQLPTISLASATSAENSSVFGVVNDLTVNNSVGRILISGKFRAYNTTAFGLDDLVYLSDSGTLSSVPGTLSVIVGRATAIDATEGVITVGSITANTNSCRPGSVGGVTT